VAAFSMSACAHHINTDSSELDAARTAIAEAKAAGAENCAPKLQAQAVASLYWAAHELTEVGYHPEENSELIARAEAKAKEARSQAKINCAPKPKPVAKPKVVEIIKLSGVNFANNSAELTPASISILDTAVATLKRRSDIIVEIAAHTSSRGAAAYNLSLSNKRAASVKDYLISHGVSANRLSSKGYGETQPIAVENNLADEAINRRVELRVMN
ncbi:OmpA family protein, partial [Mariprofundus sp. EBB-1]|uniref:OmpA family protein n=1 Tax=Mariprofundus sp. EBB-1 TaxID=2650971 RepID=UPI000F0F1D5A